MFAVESVVEVEVGVVGVVGEWRGKKIGCL
jgi:hypothetical protein